MDSQKLVDLLLAVVLATTITDFQFVVVAGFSQKLVDLLPPGWNPCQPHAEVTSGFLNNTPGRTRPCVNDVRIYVRIYQYVCQNTPNKRQMVLQFAPALLTPVRQGF